ncbi:hypothetical protein [Fictibacillus barbaricus]|uniref:Uncharacterized protein n=1 Tax=Fictibacillus barbaricus TaxID=182136 RepID=A0ABU1U1E9_9BACL|nr:hypothetical protein [Fictibacillus barbaricus]MDR7073289.1 hypothetical protein [Fictibacillus barbaricus]
MQVIDETLPLFGVNVPLIGVLLFIYGLGTVYYFAVGRHKLLPIEEEFGVFDELEDDDTEVNSSEKVI